MDEYGKKLSPQTKSTIFRMVEARTKPWVIISLLGIKPNAVVAYTFESCSLVVALNGGMLVEACFCPETLQTWKEPKNPLFTKH